jgi:ribonuclease-3
MRAELEKLEAEIGHRFHKRELLYRALTHSSHANEKQAGKLLSATLADNEQLEFLGDAVLGFLISEDLVGRFPSYPEGRLSKLKAHLVSAVHLYEVAQRLELGTYLQLGRGEEMSGGRTKKTLLVNALEALIAALYLDAGMEAVRKLVERFIIGNGDLSQTSGAPLVDFKSALQELAQARKLPQPRYAIVKVRGPEHSKLFTVEVRVGRDLAGQAEGVSKKSASQKAALEVLERLQEHD